MFYYPKFTNGYVADYGIDSTYENKLTMFHKWLTMSAVEANNTSPKNYCFNKTYASYHPQIVEDTTIQSYKYFYGRTGTRALWLGSRTTSAWINGATVAMPYVGDLDGKRLIFYLRCFQGRISTTSSTAKESVSTYYPYRSSTTSIDLNKQSRKITVGTMTDPNDATTFVPLDTIEYPYLNADYGSGAYFSTKDPSGDKGWYRAVVSLKEAKGKYIAFRHEHYGTTTIDKTLNMYIDDVTIEQIPECPAPELVEIVKLKESSVTIDYASDTENPKTAIVVATDANFANVVLRDTFNTLPFTVTGLQSLTKYYLKANVICSDLDESPYSRVLDFSTPTAVCYDNNFDEEPTHYPSNWTHSFSPSLDYLARKYSYISNPNVPSSGNSYGWKLKPALFANGKFSSTKHFVATPSKSSSKSTLWAISPVIAMDENADQHLSFDLALTERETNNPVDFSIMQGDTMMAFGVLIAEDVADTYNRENLTLW